MKSVLISIKPKWCELIVNGKKTIEVRKSRPKIDIPFKCYIYCTLPRKKVIGEFVCEKIVPITVFDNGSIKEWNFNNLSDSCVDYEELANYIGNGRTGYGWHISELVIYDSPKELSDFNLKRPPQSWCYVEE